MGDTEIAVGGGAQPDWGMSVCAHSERCWIWSLLLSSACLPGLAVAELREWVLLYLSSFNPCSWHSPGLRDAR